MYVFTHESIGSGEDGPTHQPVETLAMLRSIPNLGFLGPATASKPPRLGRSRSTVRRAGRPSSSRARGCDVAAEAGRENRSVLGGYVLAEAICSPRLVTLIATGSEVSLAR